MNPRTAPKYNFTIHFVNGERLFLKDINSERYNRLREWLDSLATDKTITFTYTDDNQYRKPTTYYFSAAIRTVIYYEVSQV